MTVLDTQVGDRKGLTGCARCPWTVTAEPVPDREQRAGHTEESGHPLCTVCSRLLPVGEGAACDGCLTRALEHLAGIRLMFDELPAHLARLRSAGGDGRRGGTDGAPLPGGDVLVLLGPGSEGLLDDETTARGGDATSVAFELGWWEQEWRERLADPVRQRPRSTRTVVHDAAGYLERKSRWAATSHPGFPQFEDDLRRLHVRLERATGRYRSPVPVAASCFDCGGVLERRIDARGLEERDATCRRCRRSYTPAAYTLALAARRQEGVAGLTGWVTVPAAAAAAGRSVRTLRPWVQKHEVPVACRVADRRLLVWFPEVKELLDRTRRRLRPETSA